jgi:hypothetical protein
LVAHFHWLNINFIFHNLFHALEKTNIIVYFFFFITDGAPNSPKKSVVSSNPTAIAPSVLTRKIQSKFLPTTNTTSNKSDDTYVAPLPLSRISSREITKNNPPHVSLPRSRSKEATCVAPVVVLRAEPKEAIISHPRTRPIETVTPVVLPSTNPTVETETNMVIKDSKDPVILVPKATSIGMRRKHTEVHSDREEGTHSGTREDIESSAVSAILIRHRRGYSTSGVFQKPLSKYDGDLDPVTSDRTCMAGTAPVQSYNIRYSKDPCHFSKT